LDLRDVHEGRVVQGNNEIASSKCKLKKALPLADDEFFSFFLLFFSNFCEFKLPSKDYLFVLDIFYRKLYKEQKWMSNQARITSSWKSKPWPSNNKATSSSKAKTTKRPSKSTQKQS
jgi:hypothetical protein